MSPANDNDNTISVLHAANYDPLPFLGRLIQREKIDKADEYIPWHIDNKYYTADVRFIPIPIPISLGKLKSLEPETGSLSGYRDVQVVLYVFDQIPLSLPSTIVKILSEPKDIALAIRSINHAEKIGGAKKQEVEGEVDNGIQTDNDVVEMFEQVGMEYIDEVNPLTEEDDERPLEPLEIVRQTLMTHLWPNMVRKPLGTGAATRFEPTSPTSSSSSQDSGSRSSPLPSPFPTQFNSRNAQPENSNSGSGNVVFPGLEELRAQIYATQFNEIDRLDKLHMDNEEDDNEDDYGPAVEEYAKLDDWLDEDDEEFEPESLRDNEDNINQERPKDRMERRIKDEEWLDSDSESGKGQAGPSRVGIPSEQGDTGDQNDWLDNDDQEYDPIASDVPPLRNSESHKDVDVSPITASQDADPVLSFEDDFDYTEFQSAQPTSSEQQTLAMDPTPLLMHLQSVREELAGVENEDERRVRAGREVAQILHSLGLGDDLDMDLDLGFDVGEGNEV